MKIIFVKNNASSNNADYRIQRVILYDVALWNRLQSYTLFNYVEQKITIFGKIILEIDIIFVFRLRFKAILIYFFVGKLIKSNCSGAYEILNANFRELPANFPKILNLRNNLRNNLREISDHLRLPKANDKPVIGQKKLALWGNQSVSPIIYI